jgi:hypothetical protein
MTPGSSTVPTSASPIGVVHLATSESAPRRRSRGVCHVENIRWHLWHLPPSAAWSAED